MTASILVAAIGLSTSFVQAPDFRSQLQREKIKALAPMVGEWKGSATFYSAGRKIPVESYELVELKAGGTALFVTGRHTMDRGGQKIVVHDAAAMIIFDAESGTYRMSAQLANGLYNQFELKVAGNTFTWSHPSPGGKATTRYTTTFGPKTWTEKGESSEDGKTWTTTMEMNLERVSK